MTSTALDNLVRINKLKLAPPNRAEFEQLLGLATTLLGTVKDNHTMAIESRSMLRIQPRERLCAHMAIAAMIDISCFNVWNIRSVGRLKNGECLIPAIAGATMPNMKVSSICRRA